MRNFQAIAAAALAAFIMLAPRALAEGGAESVLVTEVEGNVVLQGNGAPRPIEAYVRLRPGDSLVLPEDARIGMIFLAASRQEFWRGPGTLAIGQKGGSSTDLVPPKVRLLPEAVTRQIARTPTIGKDGRAGMARMRSIPTPEALAKLESRYAELREQADRDDLNPEMFLFSGLFEMRQTERLDQALSQLQASHGSNSQAKLLVSLYRRSLKNMRESGKSGATE